MTVHAVPAPEVCWCGWCRARVFTGLAFVVEWVWS
jgi:hypothetical protein